MDMSNDVCILIYAYCKTNPDTIAIAAASQVSMCASGQEDGVALSGLLMTCDVIYLALGSWNTDTYSA